jgi:hypothetical protein
MRLASILARCSLVSARHRALEGDDRQLCAVGVADLIIQDTINGYALIGERHSLECIDAAAKATILLVGHIKRTSNARGVLVGAGEGAAGAVTASPGTDALPFWTAIAESTMAFESATHMALPTARWAARLPLGSAQVEGNPT